MMYPGCQDGTLTCRHAGTCRIQYNQLHLAQETSNHVVQVTTLGEPSYKLCYVRDLQQIDDANLIAKGKHKPIRIVCQ